MRRRKAVEDPDWEPETDSSPEAFDIEDDEMPSAPLHTSPTTAGPELTADRVAAVRFHTTRPGYSFSEVEAFVDQVRESLVSLENVLYEKDVALYEAKEEQGDLQDRISTLAATIEVFRAKGDPVRAADGSYVTESQIAQAPHPDLDELRQTVESLTLGLAQAQAEKETLAQTVESLTLGLAQAQAEKETLAQTVSALEEALGHSESQRAEAEAAEDELRRYIDETLAPWLTAAANSPTVSDTNVISGDVSDPLDPAKHILVRIDAGSPPEGDTTAPDALPLPSVATAAGFAQGELVDNNVPELEQFNDEEWPGAPSIGDNPPALVPSSGDVRAEEMDTLEEAGGQDGSIPTTPSVPPLPPLPPQPSRAKARLIDAPELRGS